MPHYVLPARPSATGRAREHVHSSLSPILPPSRLADAELMTTELVANAIQHSGRPEGHPIGLEINVGSEAVWVAVVDAGRGFPPAAPAHDEGIGGWGLVLVDRLCDRWGVRTQQPHSVWFEVDR